MNEEAELQSWSLRAVAIVVVHGIEQICAKFKMYSAFWSGRMSMVPAIDPAIGHWKMSKTAINAKCG